MPVPGWAHHTIAKKAKVCPASPRPPCSRRPFRPAARLAPAEIFVLLQDPRPATILSPAAPHPQPSHTRRRCLTPSYPTDGQVRAVEAIQHFAQHVSRRVPEDHALAGPRVDSSRAGESSREDDNHTGNTGSPAFMTTPNLARHDVRAGAISLQAPLRCRETVTVLLRATIPAEDA